MNLDSHRGRERLLVTSTLVGVTMRTIHLEICIHIFHSYILRIRFPHFITGHVTVCIVVQETTMHGLMRVPDTQNGYYTFVTTLQSLSHLALTTMCVCRARKLVSLVTGCYHTVPPASWRPLKDVFLVYDHSPQP